MGYYVFFFFFKSRLKHDYLYSYTSRPVRSLTMLKFNSRLVLQNGLKSNFADAKVTVVECPDLSQDPFNFPAKGKRIWLFLLILLLF